MARYSDGDAAAFSVLYRRYGGRLYHFLRDTTGSRVLAEDLCQQTWLQLHRARQRYRPEASFAPWIYTIAANLRRNVVRRRRRRPEELTADGQLPPGVLSLLGLPGESLDAGRGAAEQRLIVRRALFALPEGYRLVILMHSFKDLSFPEIAAALGTSVGAVKVRASRGYERLRLLLGPAA